MWPRTLVKFSTDRWKERCGTHIQWNTTQPQREQIWVSFSEMDEPRACSTVWSKSETERFLLHKQKSQKCHTRCLYHFRISFASQRMEKADGSEVRRDIGVCSPLQPHLFTLLCHDFKPLKFSTCWSLCLECPFLLEDPLDIFWDWAWTWLSLYKLPDTLCF